MKKIITLSFMVVAAVGLFFTSCKKTDLSFDENDKTIAQENAVAQQHFADVASIADEASSKEGFTNFRIMTTCATTVKDSSNGKHISTVTFDGSACADGKHRFGSIVISYSGSDYKVPGTIASVTFVGYKVENTTLTGSVTLTNTTAQGTSNPLKFTLTVDASLATFSQTSSFTGTLTKTWDQGTDLNSRTDDIYYLDGSVSGVTYNGTKYTAAIVSQLEKFANYRCIVKGKITLINQSSSSTSLKTIDFGDGTRDAIATITVDGITKTIDL